MIAQVVLISNLLLVIIYALTQLSRSRYLSIGAILSALSGITLVVYPEISNVLAKGVGIGRGVDLIFYIFMVVTYIMLFNLHVRAREHTETVTELARGVALLAVRSPISK